MNNKTILFLFIYFSIPSFLSGQIQFGEPTVIDSSSCFRESICVTDIDGDGDMDVVSPILDGRLAWFENIDGRGRFGHSNTISSSTTIISSIYSADLDNDGDKDLLIAYYDFSGTPNIVWFENTNGRGTFSAGKTISSEADHPKSVYAADLDHDGDMDVLSASEGDDKIAWYANMDGHGTFGAQQILTDSTEQAQAVIAKDIDNDNDLDIIAASSHFDNIIWFENTDGQGSFSNKTVITTTPEYVSSLDLGDIDNDGDTDILVSCWIDDDISWYENTNGQGTFGSQKLISIVADSLQNAKQVEYAGLVDLDNDDDLDILSACNDGSIIWYENENGHGSFSSAKKIADEGRWMFSAYPTDFDGDGDMDILTAPHDRVVWYENLVQSASVKENRSETPNSFVLYQNFPNPFNPQTVISYKLSVISNMSLKMFDILGREVITLVNGIQSPGMHTVEWNGKNSAGQEVGSGIYFCRLQYETCTKTIKLTLIK